MAIKKRLLFLPSLLIYSFTNAQQSDQISDWISTHPDVHIISTDNYLTISQSFREKIKDKVIVFNGHVTLEDIQEYENQQESVVTQIPFTGLSENQEVKDWLANHPEITILSRSYFNSLNNDEQVTHIEGRSMILIGEILTAEDIQNY